MVSLEIVRPKILSKKIHIATHWLEVHSEKKNYNRKEKFKILKPYIKK